MSTNIVLLKAAQPAPAAASSGSVEHLMTRASTLSDESRADADAIMADAVALVLSPAELDALAAAMARSTGRAADGYRHAMQAGRVAADREAGQPPPPMSSMPHVMTPDEALAEMNARCCFVADHGGTATYATIGPNRTIQPRSKEEMAAIFASYAVELPDGKGGARFVPVFLWWSMNRGRNAYDRSLYDPEGMLTLPGERVLNTWRGLALEPAQGSWRRMRRHLYLVICNGDRWTFKYLLRWLAHVVQRPGTSPGVMIVLRSDREGTGKSSVARWMRAMLGPHAHEANGHREIVGDFNEAVVEKSFVVLEEAVFPGDHKAADALKAMITAETLRINPKGKRGYVIPNSLHLMMTTNNRRAVFAGADARRFLVLDVQRKMDRAYFDALHAEAGAGGVEAMLDALLKIDLGRFNPREVPTTQALIEQQRQSADDTHRWISDAVLGDGLVPGLQGGSFGCWVSSAALHRGYSMWARDQGIRHLKSLRAVMLELKALGCTQARTAAANGWHVPTAAVLIAAADLRAGIRTR